MACLLQIEYNMFLGRSSKPLEVVVKNTTKKVQASQLAINISHLLGIHINQVLGYLDQIKWARDEPLQPIRPEDCDSKYQGRILPWVLHERQENAGKNWKKARSGSSERYQFEEQWNAATADAIRCSITLEEIVKTVQLAQKNVSNHTIAIAVRKIARILRASEMAETRVANQER